MAKSKEPQPVEKKSKKELVEALQRLQADFANYKRRAEEERVSLANFSKQQVIVQLLPVLDNISRALQHVPKKLASDEWAKGVAQVGKQLEGELRQLGVAKIATEGEEFDPHFHEAVSVDGDNGKYEVITDEVQAGYRLNDEVIRHAMVRVKRTNSKPKNKEEDK